MKTPAGAMQAAEYCSCSPLPLVLALRAAKHEDYAGVLAAWKAVNVARKDAFARSSEWNADAGDIAVLEGDLVNARKHYAGAMDFGRRDPFFTSRLYRGWMPADAELDALMARMTSLINEQRVAKMIDCNLFVLGGGFLSGATYFAAFPERLPSTFLGTLVLGMALIIASIPIEAAFLTLTGTTPGKALMATRVVVASGARPTFLTALKRSGTSYALGLGAGIPIIALVALAAGYNQLQNDGVTIWDRRFDTYVVHEKLNVWRWIAGVALVLAAFVYQLLANMAPT
jgi:uncharacterized RDD family membrane protein YckC